MNTKKFIFALFYLSSSFLFSQNIEEVNHNVSNNSVTEFNNSGTILYPEGYPTENSKTPVLFVHGFTATLSKSYDANIKSVIKNKLNAAFVQLEPMGTTYNNGILLAKMIDKVREFYNTETISIVAHSKGGLDTERALYGQSPYTNNISPSFFYEKVDAVYTFGSPLEGARVADLGASLSLFSGIPWAVSWFNNAETLTSGSINSFHNWAKSWSITSDTTFKNYYNPNGASYINRINMEEDNTTRWWAHQSDDECYDNNFVYCYIGKTFHYTIGAYLDAYWEWNWFNSGWENWHPNSDGFISEYRAKRNQNSDPTPRLTPGAGDFNYRTTQDANHSSLWEEDEDHFEMEVVPYLHRGLYGTVNYNSSSREKGERELKNPVKAKESQIIASNGNMYFGKNNKTDFIVEETNKTIEFIIYSDSAINSFELVNKITNKNTTIDILRSETDDFSGASVSVANISNLEKGTYTLKTDKTDFLVLANNTETSTAFALNLNFNEKVGYNGETLEIGIANKDNAIDLSKVNIEAYISQLSIDHNTPIKMDKVKMSKFVFKPTSKDGIYSVSFPNLNPASTYSMRIVAKVEEGEVLLSRNIVSSFYVKKGLDTKSIAVESEKTNIDEENLETSFKVYPNPTSAVINVRNTTEIISNIDLFNALGQKVNSFKVNALGYSIDVKKLKLPKGLYILKIKYKSGKSIKEEKIILL